jgi:hypothetical protein
MVAYHHQGPANLVFISHGFLLVARMKNALLLLAGSLLGAVGAQAQTPGTSQAATAEQRLAEDLGVDRLRNALQLPSTDARNTATLLQMGTSNAATIDQTSLGVPPNQATVMQAGAGNALGLTQTGSNNQTAFGQTGNANQATLRQTGSNNVLQGQVTGDDNALDVTQQGQGNRYSTQLTGSHGRYNVDQVGTGNTLIQREAATTTPLPGYNVQQQGTGMQLTIEQGKAY